VTAQSALGLVGENKPGQTLRRRHRVGVGDSESTSPEIEDFWCADESRSDSSTSAESQSDSDVRTRASLSLTPAETALPVDSLAESVKCVRQTASGGLSDTSDNVVETGSLGVVRKTESSVMTRDEVSRTTCPRGTSPVSRKSASPVLAHGVRSVRTGGVDRPTTGAPDRCVGYSYDLPTVPAPPIRTNGVKYEPRFI
jgi:hypothetical protein